MKKIILSSLFVIIVSSIIMSCGGGAGDPKDVAVRFTKALNAMDYKTARDLGTPETAKMIDFIESISSMGMITDSMKEVSKKLKVDVKDAKIENENATITVTNGDKGEEALQLVKREYTMKKNDSTGKFELFEKGGTKPANEYEKEEDAQKALKAKSGKWLVKMSKDDMTGGTPIPSEVGDVPMEENAENNSAPGNDSIMAK